MKTRLWPAGLLFGVSFVVMGVFSIPNVHALAPASKVASLQEVLDSLQTDPFLRYRITRGNPAENFKQILRAAWNDIWLPEDLKSRRAAKIFENNPDRIDDLLHRLMQHGMDRFKLSGEELREIVVLVQGARFPGMISASDLLQKTTFDKPAEFLLALDHALNPDPYHPVKPRSFYLARESRLLCKFSYHGPQGERAIKDAVNSQLEELLQARGAQKVWILAEDYLPGQFMGTDAWRQIQAPWGKVVNELLKDSHREQGFTPEFMERNKQDKDLLLVLQGFAHMMDHALSRIMPRDYLIAMVRSGATAGNINTYAQMAEDNPHIAGVLTEPLPDSPLDIMNAVLAEYLLDSRTAALHLSKDFTPLEAHRMGHTLDMAYNYVYRDDLMLDLAAGVLQQDSQACLAVTRGASHQWMGKWLDSDFSPDFSDEKGMSQHHVLPMLGGKSKESMRSAREIIEHEITAKLIPFVIANQRMTQDEARAVLEAVVGKMQDGVLTQLHDAVYERNYTSSTDILFYFHEQGLWPKTTPPLWEDLPMFRLFQLLEADQTASFNPRFAMMLSSAVCKICFILKAADLLSGGMTSQERAEFFVLASEQFAYGDDFVESLFQAVFERGFDQGLAAFPEIGQSFEALRQHDQNGWTLFHELCRDTERNLQHHAPLLLRSSDTDAADKILLAAM